MKTIIKTNITKIQRQYQFALVLFFAFSLGLSACKKTVTTDIQPDPGTPNQPQGKLVRMEMSANNYMVLGYETTSGLLNHFRLVNDNYTSDAHFGYNAAKKPTNGVIDAFELNFVYADGVLDKIEYTAATPNPQMADHYQKFSYTNGRVSQVTDYFKVGANLVPGGKHVYTYYANGDVKTEVYLYLVNLPDHFEQIARTEYEYDDKVNPLQPADEILYALYLPKAAHNIKKAIVYDASDHLDETRSYSLNYNIAGLPTTGVESTTYPNSPAINKNVKYFYQ